MALNEAGLGQLLLNDSPQLHNNSLPSESTHRDFFEINELQQGVPNSCFVRLNRKKMVWKLIAHDVFAALSFTNLLN